MSAASDSLLGALREKAGPGSFSVAGARYVVALENEVAALRLEARAQELVAYGNALPNGVTTEAFAEAENLRREAARLRG